MFVVNYQILYFENFILFFIVLLEWVEEVEASVKMHQWFIKRVASELYTVFISFFLPKLKEAVLPIIEFRSSAVESWLFAAGSFVYWGTLKQRKVAERIRSFTAMVIS